MDIRTITNQVPQVPKVKNENLLQAMFDLNLEQLEKYKKIEGLPDYPFDINNPKNQVILKDFISRIIEELCEGYESTEEIASIFSYKGWNLNILTEEEYIKVKNSLANANEEQADAMGFFFTLLAYSNILPEDILSYKGLKTLDEVIIDGKISLRKASLDPDSDQYWAYDILLDTDDVEPYFEGFRKMSDLTHIKEKLYLWEVIYELNNARNLLKCRPWKQTQIMTKELPYQESLVKAFYLYVGFLGINYFNARSLYELFYLKQQLNLWRIKSGY